MPLAMLCFRSKVLVEGIVYNEFYINFCTKKVYIIIWEENTCVHMHLLYLLYIVVFCGLPGPQEWKKIDSAKDLGFKMARGNERAYTLDP